MAITDYAYLKEVIPQTDCPGARLIARQTITLSTSSFLKDKEQKEIICRIKKPERQHGNISFKEDHRK